MLVGWTPAAAPSPQQLACLAVLSVAWSLPCQPLAPRRGSLSSELPCRYPDKQLHEQLVDLSKVSAAMSTLLAACESWLAEPEYEAQASVSRTFAAGCCNGSQGREGTSLI